MLPAAHGAGSAGFGEDELKRTEIKNYHAPLELLQEQHIQQSIFNGGYVKYVEHHGSDKLIAKAARTSFVMDEYKSDDANEALIDHLIRNHHGSPTELPGITFQFKVPMQLKNQLIRHRTARLNEGSLRYVEHDGTFYIPDLDQCCHQDEAVKQGQHPQMSVEMATAVQLMIAQQCESANEMYERLLRPPYSMAREQARGVLTLNHYVTLVWQMDLRNLMWLLLLRLDEHAQGPIRQFAALLENVFKDLFPATHRSFEEHILHGIQLSRGDQKAIAQARGDVNMALASVDAQIQDFYLKHKDRTLDELRKLRPPGILLERKKKFERILAWPVYEPADTQS